MITMVSIQKSLPPNISAGSVSKNLKEEFHVGLSKNFSPIVALFWGMAG